jgi:hypothetical protein
MVRFDVLYSKFIAVNYEKKFEYTKNRKVTLGACIWKVIVVNETCRENAILFYHPGLQVYTTLKKKEAMWLYFSIALMRQRHFRVLKVSSVINQVKPLNFSTTRTPFPADCQNFSHRKRNESKIVITKHKEIEIYNISHSHGCSRKSKSRQFLWFDSYLYSAIIGTLIL